MLVLGLKIIYAKSVFNSLAGGKGGAQEMKTKTKYIFVTGGVISGVGKGIMAASMGAILKAKGLKVSIQKCDP
jgi:hypothetical protein